MTCESASTSRAATLGTPMPDANKKPRPTTAGQPAKDSPAASRPGGRRRGAGRAKRLIDTAGPDPNASVEDIRLTVGVIVGSHGVHGELRMSLQTDYPDTLLGLERVWLGDSDEPVRLESVRFHGDGAL